MSGGTWQLTLLGLFVGTLVGMTGMGGGSLMTPLLMIILSGFKLLEVLSDRWTNRIVVAGTLAAVLGFAVWGVRRVTGKKAVPLPFDEVPAELDR
jgi:uncharacterized membrane protein YfcA